MTTVAIRQAGNSSSVSPPKYFVSHQPHGQVPAPKVGYGDSQGRIPMAFQSVGRNAGKLPAQGKNQLIGDAGVFD